MACGAVVCGGMEGSPGVLIIGLYWKINLSTEQPHNTDILGLDMPRDYRLRNGKPLNGRPRNYRLRNDRHPKYMQMRDLEIIGLKTVEEKRFQRKW